MSHRHVVIQLTICAYPIGGGRLPAIALRHLGQFFFLDDPLKCGRGIAGCFRLCFRFANALIVTLSGFKSLRPSLGFFFLYTTSVVPLTTRTVAVALQSLTGHFSPPFFYFMVAMPLRRSTVPNAGLSPLVLNRSPFVALRSVVGPRLLDCPFSFTFRGSRASFPPFFVSTPPLLRPWSDVRQHPGTFRADHCPHQNQDTMPIPPE